METKTFDAAQYLASYGDLITAFGYDLEAATQHYIQYGFNEGRATDLFDEAQYLASYGDLITAFGNDLEAATQHYIQYGFNEGRAVDLFDEARYLASYGDLITAFGNDLSAATQHYIQYGFNEGRATDLFDPVQYLANYSDLRAAFGNDLSAATQHYIQYGYHEGRIYSPTVPSTYQAFDASQVFALNSNPGANHTIYLDFDGHTTSNTSWNDDYGDNLITPAYDTDGDTSNFSTAELQDIWSIWQRVSEDFIPFDVNVTTAQPSTDQLIKSGSNDPQWGVRVAIGGSDSDWLNKNYGGVAKRNSFNLSTDTPAFAFSADFSSVQNVAELVSHEIGHTLGLSHDGTSKVEYYRGHGSGATSWAPIMGSGYNRAVTQWSQGEYTDAENSEDDLSIITSNNGFGYRTDDYGDELLGAAVLSVGDAESATYGIIETNTDVDWFKFTSSTGNISLAIDPFINSPNLDILAELYNASGQFILGSNPTNGLSASFDLSTAPGEYYLSVTGTGQGKSATGYSDYGSLGQYSISGTIV